MFGSIYYKHPEILLQSLHEMNGVYKGKIQTSSPIQSWFARIYIHVFGIPEIGFQVRGMYFRQALRSLGAISPKTILDIGSGIGCYSFFMAKKYPNAKIVGWEIDKNKLMFAKGVQKEFGVTNTKFAFGDIVKNHEGRNIYDFMIIIDVLEHIKDYKIVLKNMYRLLKIKAYVYIHVPHVHQVRHFHEFASWEHADHVREGFDLTILKKDLLKIGFRVIESKYTFGFFGSLAWELNHMVLAKNQFFTALVYPAIYGLSLIDRMTIHKRGLGLSILVQKI